MGDKIPRLSQNGFDESRISSDRFKIFVSRDVIGVDRLDLELCEMPCILDRVHEILSCFDFCFLVEIALESNFFRLVGEHL